MLTNVSLVEVFSVEVTLNKGIKIMFNDEYQLFKNAKNETDSSKAITKENLENEIQVRENSSNS